MGEGEVDDDESMAQGLFVHVGLDEVPVFVERFDGHHNELLVLNHIVQLLRNVRVVARPASKRELAGATCVDCVSRIGWRTFGYECLPSSISFMVVPSGTSCGERQRWVILWWCSITHLEEGVPELHTAVWAVSTLVAADLGIVDAVDHLPSVLPGVVHEGPEVVHDSRVVVLEDLRVSRLTKCGELDVGELDLARL